MLQDTEGILVQQTENSQASRQIRFKNLKEISEKAAILKAYIFEAVEVEKAGLKIIWEDKIKNIERKGHFSRRFIEGNFTQFLNTPDH